MGKHFEAIDSNSRLPEITVFPCLIAHHQIEDLRGLEIADEAEAWATEPTGGAPAAGVEEMDADGLKPRPVLRAADGA